VPRDIRQLLDSAGLLWLVSNGGTLDSLDLHAALASRHLVESRVTSIHQASSGALWVTTLDPDHRLRVRAREVLPGGDERWMPLMEVTTDAADAWLEEIDGAALVLTPSTLFRWIDGKIQPIALSTKIEPWLPSQAVVGRSLYIGTNRGEWGGGLQRVSIDTGAVSTIGAGSTLLDGEPVTSVIADATPGCVLAAVGLSHFLTRGRVLWVCGDSVTLAASWRVSDDRGINATEAVFSLLRTSPHDGRSDEYWAATTSGVHHWQEGEEELLPYGKFDIFCGVHLSHLAPTVVAVSTTVNASRSLSGSTALLSRLP
jgi:hypothetical protein